MLEAKKATRTSDFKALQKEFKDFGWRTVIYETIESLCTTLDQPRDTSKDSSLVRNYAYLMNAIRTENYEQASKLRDTLKGMQ